MTVLTDLAAWSVIAFGVLLLAVQVAAQEVGYWFGRRDRARADGQSESVGIVVGGMLGLMAFVLALTLSFANTRFSERRAGALAEANAIGTAWLRAQAIGNPRGVEIARLLEEYTQVRIDFVQADRDPPRIDQLNQRINALQSRIWGHLAAIVREQPNPVATSLMAAINDTFDMTTAERLAYETRLPPQLFWLLITMTLMGMAALGYQVGLRGRPVRILAALLTVMWTLVIVDILDLVSPRLGTFRTSAAAYEWTLQGFKGGLSIPPQPSSQ